MLQVPVGQKDAEKGSVELMEDVPPHKQILAEVLLLHAVLHLRSPMQHVGANAQNCASAQQCAALLTASWALPCMPSIMHAV